MPLSDILQYLIFLLFLPVGLFAILKGRLYMATIAVMVAFVDLIILGLKLVGIA